MVSSFHSKTLLALETATPVCSVSLRLPLKKNLNRFATGVGVHSEKTFEFVQEVLDEAGITFSNVDAVLVNKGPGSYTGLRIGSSAAKGLLFGSKKKLISVDTLASIAFGGFKKLPHCNRIHAVINARRTHLYHQLYNIKDDILVAVDEPGIKSLNQISALLSKDDGIVGTGINRLSESSLVGIQQTADEEMISASNMIDIVDNPQLSAFYREENPSLFEPLYQFGDF